MRDKKFREATFHASGEVSASAFPVGHLPASRLRLRDIFLIARPPLLRDAGGASTLQPYVFCYFGQLCLVRRGVLATTPDISRPGGEL